MPKNVYHASFATDRECEQANGQCQDTCFHNGYDLSISRSFGHGPAILVLTVPSAIDPKTVGGYEWVLVEETVDATSAPSEFGPTVVPTTTEEEGGNEAL